MQIGFIGLGNMGAPMATNLVAAGHTVAGYDISATPAGINIAGSLAEAAADKDAVICMLPNGSIVRDVANSIIPSMQPGALLIDCSTIDVESARHVAEQAQTAGLLPLDAPVSGGMSGATAGTLTFMVGGLANAYEQGLPLFDVLGQKSVHCGQSGNGQAAKICNNMILGISMLATCEAFVLADKLGLDRQAMFDVVSTSSGNNWSMSTYCPAPGIGPTSPADNNYQPGFAAELMLKDLKLSQQAADAVNAPTPMGVRATELFTRFVETEQGRGKDFSAILISLENQLRQD